jgi:hypothetical protein
MNGCVGDDIRPGEGLLAGLVASLSSNPYFGAGFGLLGVGTAAGTDLLPHIPTKKGNA